MKKSTKQQELADKIARIKAAKGKNVDTTNTTNSVDDNVKNAKVVNANVKKPAPVKAMKPMKNMSSGRKG